MPLSSSLLLFCLHLAPSEPDAPSVPDPTPEAAYSEAQAHSDVEALLTARGRDYLGALRRLQKHPILAAPAIAARLDAMPPPGPAEQRRLLEVLSSFKRPGDLSRFGDPLRSALLTGKDSGPWEELLREQGAAAAPIWLELVADTRLEEALRARLLGEFVNSLPEAELESLIEMFGRGDRRLEAALRRALKRRFRRSPRLRQAFLTAIDTALPRADPARLPALILTRAALSERDDPEAKDLEGFARDEDQRFAVRIASIHALGQLGQGEATLEAIARAHGDPSKRNAQASELLVWMSILSLPESSRRSLIDALALRNTTAPRFLLLAYHHGSLAPTYEWLEESQQNPWPEVRRAALDRIEGDCPAPVTKRLRTIAGRRSAGGDADEGVGRSAISALGRCGDREGLQRLLSDTGVPLLRRGEAARQLAAQPEAEGIRSVLRLLGQNSDPELLVYLADALGQIPQGEAASPAISELEGEVAEALCRLRTNEDASVAAASARALSRRFHEQSCAETSP